MTVGHPRISVVALLGPQARDWTPAEWELLRESGVSVVCLENPPRGVPVPAVDRADVAVGADSGAKGIFFFDTAFQVGKYPEWALTATRLGARWCLGRTLFRWLWPAWWRARRWSLWNVIGPANWSNS